MMPQRIQKQKTKRLLEKEKRKQKEVQLLEKGKKRSLQPPLRGNVVEEQERQLV